MAFFKTFGSDIAIGESDYDPQKLSSPQVFLLSMVVFLAIVGFIAAILYRQISHAFVTNPGLNGLIIGVLASASCLPSRRSSGCSGKCAGSTRSAPAPRSPIRCCWRR